MTRDEDANRRWTIKDNRLTRSAGDSYQLSIDDVKTPAEFDLIVITPAGQPLRTGFRGILKLEGDKLTVCMNPGKNRPAKLESTNRDGNLYFEFSRHK